MADELLDVYDEHGRHLGVKPRAAVHRDGDWHRAFHLWVVSAAGVLLQRRATTKASWPGRLDATAAGHLVAGEQVRDGLREADEELGASFSFEDLVALGVHRVDDPMGEGGHNRELQHVFAIRYDRPLDSWTAFDRRELAGLVLVDHAGFATLIAGTGEPVSVTTWDGETATAATATSDELVPSPYLKHIAGALAALGRV